MKEYIYEDIDIGTECRFEVNMSFDKMQKFLEITGDENPLHVDGEFAKLRGYKGQVVYGMLTASLMSTVAGMYLPGKNSLIHSIEGKFVKPVFVNEDIEVIGRVKSKDDLFKVLDIAVVCLNSNKEKVFKGKMKVGVLDDES